MGYLPDIVAVQVALSGCDGDRLKAADMLNKVRGRYAPDGQPTISIGSIINQLSGHEPEHETLEGEFSLLAPQDEDS